MGAAARVGWSQHSAAKVQPLQARQCCSNWRPMSLPPHFAGSSVGLDGGQGRGRRFFPQVFGRSEIRGLHFNAVLRSTVVEARDFNFRFSVAQGFRHEERVLDAIDAVLVVAGEREDATDFDERWDDVLQSALNEGGDPRVIKTRIGHRRLARGGFLKGAVQRAKGSDQFLAKAGCFLLAPSDLFSEHAKELDGALFVFPLLQSVSASFFRDRLQGCLLYTSPSPRDS